MKRPQPLLLAISIPLLALSAEAQVFGGGTPHAPYSITQETERSQTLADETHIDTKTQRHFYRDSYGRTMNDFPYPAALPISGIARIEIHDPVADRTYILDVRQKTATLLAEVRPDSGNVPPQPVNPIPNPPPQNIRPQITNEDLGTQTIDGIVAKGTRMTITVPTGQQGNDRPIVTVRETWTSPGLPVPVYSKISDPRNGDTITRIVSIDRSEPDPALFQVPPDYVIRDLNQQ